MKKKLGTPVDTTTFPQISVKKCKFHNKKKDWNYFSASRQWKEKSQKLIPKVSLNPYEKHEYSCWKGFPLLLPYYAYVMTWIIKFYYAR